MTKKIRLMSVVILFLAGLSIVPAQRIDPDHIASAEYYIPINGGADSVLLPLAEGKLLALLINSNSRSVMRINEDGGRDTSFNCAACSFEMRSIAVQRDGKYLVAGSSGNSSRIIRVNADGSIDPSFSSPFASNQTITAVYTVTPAGQIYASTREAGLRRLNSDGSFDNSFTPQSLGSIGMIRKIMMQPDGKILVHGVQVPAGGLFRLNVDGTTDAGWTRPSLTFVCCPPIFLSPYLNDALLQADGKVVIVGLFDRVNTTLRRNIARLNPDGTVDSAPAPNVPWGGNPQSRLMLQSDGKLVLYTDTQEPTSGFRRLNTDFTVDSSFNTLLISLRDWGIVTAINGNDQVTFAQGGTLRRLNTDGTQDNNVEFTYRTYSPVTAIAVQADGKSVVAGSFTYLNDVIQPTIGRLNPDGTRDDSFVTGTGFSSAPSKIAEQAGGKILAFGNFTSYNGVPNTGLIRLNSDGSLDASFAPAVSGVNSFTVQPDGKILLFGGNITVNHSSRTGLARLNSDGTLDIPFNPLIGSPTINGAVVHPDGKITIAGSFASVNGVNRSNLARLNADGTLDTTLDAGNIGPLSLIALAPNGQYIITRSSGPAVYRVNSNGAIDTSFVSPTILTNTNTNSVRAILPLPGGSVIIGGSFTGPRPNILRLTPKGSLDNVFLPTGASGPVLDLARQGNSNKFLAVGEFATIGGVSRLSIARITVPGAPFDFDGDGRADFMVTRPSDYNWHLLTSGTYNYTATHFGTSGDKVVPGDYDGDGKTDIAIWRPSTGDWWWIESSTGAVLTRNLGTSGDTPLPSDTDGDGKADLVVVTPGYIWKGIKASTGEVIVYHQFGQTGDQPVTGDFDGDGKFDLAFFRGSGNAWYYNRSSSGASLQVVLIHWGTAGDIPVPADYDGDGITDAGVFRPSEGNWYVRGPAGIRFGTGGDKPAPADYDGDGKADIAVFRPSDGYWYQLPTTGGYTGLPWGIGSDIPAPNALIP